MKNRSLRLKGGFGQVSNTVIRDPELSLQEKGLYAYLATYACSSTNELHVSINRIASECGLTPSTVKRIIKKLLDMGIVDRRSSGLKTARTTVLLK